MTATTETTITLTARQYQHYTDGDGLFVAAPHGRLLTFLHEQSDRLYRDAVVQLDGISAATAQLTALQSLLASDEPLDLSITGRRGLGQMLDQIAGLLQEPEPEPE